MREDRKVRRIITSRGCLAVNIDKRMAAENERSVVRVTMSFELDDMLCKGSLYKDSDVSREVASRLASFSTGNPLPLSLIGARCGPCRLQSRVFALPFLDILHCFGDISKSPRQERSVLVTRALIATVPRRTWSLTDRD